MGWVHIMGSKMGHLLPHSSDLSDSRKPCEADHGEHEENGGGLEQIKQHDHLRRTVSEDIRREEGRGHDISFVPAILLSFFGCSEAGLRCADDPPIGTKLERGRSETLLPKSNRKLKSIQHQVSAAASSKNFLKDPLISPDEKEKVLPESKDSDRKDPLYRNSDFGAQQQQDMSVPSRLPSMSETSSLLSEGLQRCILPALPNLARGRQWAMLYSTRKHGISLLTLYRKSSLVPGPFLLVTGDTKGAVLGGFLFAPLKPTPKKKYQGTHNTFVFTDVSGKPELYLATGLNRYFVLCTNEALAIGGGSHFALHLDSDLLTGSTGTSETFGNIPLAHSEEFVVKDVELWGFLYPSKYLPRHVSFVEPKQALGISS